MTVPPVGTSATATFEAATPEPDAENMNEVAPVPSSETTLVYPALVIPDQFKPQQRLVPDDVNGSPVTVRFPLAVVCVNVEVTTLNST